MHDQSSTTTNPGGGAKAEGPKRIVIALILGILCMAMLLSTSTPTSSTTSSSSSSSSSVDEPSNPASSQRDNVVPLPPTQKEKVHQQSPTSSGQDTEHRKPPTPRHEEDLSNKNDHDHNVVGGDQYYDEQPQGPAAPTSLLDDTATTLTEAVQNVSVNGASFYWLPTVVDRRQSEASSLTFYTTTETTPQLLWSTLLRSAALPFMNGGATSKNKMKDDPVEMNEMLLCERQMFSGDLLAATIDGRDVTHPISSLRKPLQLRERDLHASLEVSSSMDFLGKTPPRGENRPEYGVCNEDESNVGQQEERHLLILFRDQHPPTRRGAAEYAEDLFAGVENANRAIDDVEDTKKQSKLSKKSVKVDTVEVMWGVGASQDASNSRLHSCNSLPAAAPLSDTLLCAAQLVQIMSADSSVSRCRQTTRGGKKHKVYGYSWSRVWVMAQFGEELLADESEEHVFSRLSQTIHRSEHRDHLTTFWRGKTHEVSIPGKTFEGVIPPRVPRAPICPYMSFLKSSCYDLSCTNGGEMHSTVHTTFANQVGEKQTAKKDTTSEEMSFWDTTRKHLWPPARSEQDPPKVKLRTPPEERPRPFILSIPTPTDPHLGDASAPSITLFQKLATAAHFDAVDASRAYMRQGDTAPAGTTTSFLAATIGMLMTWATGSRPSSPLATYFAPVDGIAFATSGESKDEHEAALQSLWEVWRSSGTPKVSPPQKKSPLLAGAIVSVQNAVKSRSKPGRINKHNQHTAAREFFAVPPFVEDIKEATGDPLDEKLRPEPNVTRHNMADAKTLRRYHANPGRKFIANYRSLDHQLCGGVVLAIAVRNDAILKRDQYKEFIRQLQTQVRRVIVLSHWRNEYNEGIWPLPAICTDNHASVACFGWLSRLQFVRDSCGVIFMHSDAFLDLSRFFSTTSTGGVQRDGQDDEPKFLNEQEIGGMSDPHEFAGCEMSEMRKFSISAKETLALIYPMDNWGLWRTPMKFGRLGSFYGELMIDSWSVTTDVAAKTFPELQQGAHLHILNKRFNNFGDLFYVPTSVLKPKMQTVPTDEVFTAKTAQEKLGLPDHDRRGRQTASSNSGGQSGQQEQQQLAEDSSSSKSPSSSSSSWHGIYPFDAVMDVFQDITERSEVPTVISPEGIIGQLAAYVSTVLGNEYRRDLMDAKSFLGHTSARGTSLENLARKIPGGGAAVDERKIEVPPQTEKPWDWSSAIVRTFSLIGHCCQWMPHSIMNNYYFVAGHKIALERREYTALMLQRVMPQFTCSKKAFRLQALTAEGDDFVWIGRLAGAVPEHLLSGMAENDNLAKKQTTTTSINKKKSSRRKTVLASTTTTCKVVVELGATDAPYDLIPINERGMPPQERAAAKKMNEKGAVVPRWSPNGGFMQPKESVATEFIIQAPLTTDVIVDLPIATKNGRSGSSNPKKRDTVLYVIAPSAHRIRLRIPSSSGDNNNNNFATGLRFYIVTGATMPFSATVSPSNNKPVPHHLPQGSRDRDLLLVHCSAEALKTLRQDSSSSTLDQSSTFAVDVTMNLSPFGPGRGGKGPSVHVTLMQSGGGSGSALCEVMLMSREELFPSWRTR